jgi:hypothetical protein
MTTKLQDQVAGYQADHLRHLHNTVCDINALTSELADVCASFTGTTYTNEAARLVGKLQDRLHVAAEVLAVLQVLREVQK